LDFPAIVIEILNGLATASSLFLVSAGLSIIFGVTRIVNFAHGSLYMLGAYGAYWLADRFGAGAAGYYGAMALAALGVGGLGALIELGVLRRIYRAPELFQLLATFGLVLIAGDGVLMLFGPQDLLGPRAPGLIGAVSILGRPYPEIELALIALGPIVLGLLWALFYRTRWGTLVRAATLDREMVGALGVNQARLFTSVFFVGSFLAGLGGAVQLPREAIHHQMDLQIITEAFVVVVVGGLGSLPGAFLAALLIGELHAFGILLFPKITLVLVFLVMAAVLVVRPWGLLGRAEGVLRVPGAEAEAPLVLTGRAWRVAWAAVAALLLAAPWVFGAYTLSVLTEIAILALFAASLHLIMGAGGMASFGHAAYFGLGSYGAALAVKTLALPLLPALACGVLAAGLGALVFGWASVRLSGVYMAMLTLAFAQIAFAVSFQWYEVTGGDNGLLGIWPTGWARDRTAFYYLALALCGMAVLGLRHVFSAPFGYTLRAVRDSPLRAEAVGIDRRLHQLLAFLLAGLCAGLAGGLYAFFKGSVFPDNLGIATSLDALVMVLLGGVNALSGPLAGTLVYKTLHLVIAAWTDRWHFILGFIIVALVIAFPQGIAGALRRFAERGAARP
jgi:branched-chain amino acid transport system permease protein